MAENKAASWISVLYIAFIENILKHILVRYKKAGYLICSITKWYSTKFVQIMVLCSKWYRPGGHRVYEAVIAL